MTLREIAGRRLRGQRLALAAPAGPAELVAGLGGLQAQDYQAALWAIGLRSPDAGLAELEAAVAGGSIIRSWPMRGTLHFVAAADLGWMMELFGPRNIAAGRRRRAELEIDAAVLSKCRKLFVKALSGGRRLARDVLYKKMEAAGISAAGQRGYHILFNLAQEGLICFGGRDGKQQTFALLEERAPRAKRFERGEALAELALRYFFSHGPAALPDFAWWSGLSGADARAGLEAAAADLASEKLDGQSYWFAPDAAPGPRGLKGVRLLPSFDEYLLGYRDRAAVLDARHAGKVAPGANGLFRPIVVVDGRVAGTWKRVLCGGRLELDFDFFDAGRSPSPRGLAEAAGRYARFLGLPLAEGR